ncbi:trehalose-phosphatase [Microbacterium sp. NPDC091313]
MSSVAEDLLEPLARTPRLLVAVDFDGTLSPLQKDAMAARMLPAARRSVEALAALPDTTVALVSGRSLVDLRVIAEHDDASPLWLAGSHGAEFWEPGVGALASEDMPAEVALRDRIRAEAEKATAGLEGVWIEPKTFGVGVHTRGMPEELGAEANRLVDELVAREAPAWRRRTGHHILEFSFRHEGKDSAVATLRERTHATAVLFAGDDVTDEDAMRTLGKGDLGVRVGAGETAASVTVADIAAFADLLALLAKLRGSQPE